MKPAAILRACGLAFPLVLPSCLSVLGLDTVPDEDGDGRYEVPFESDPPGATVTIEGLEGSWLTNCVIPLEPDRDYRVTFIKPGYEPYTTVVEGRRWGLAAFGNFAPVVAILATVGTGGVAAPVVVAAGGAGVLIDAKRQKTIDLRAPRPVLKPQAVDPAGSVTPAGSPAAPVVPVPET